MPRLPFQFSPDDYYHLCARSNNRDWFDLPLEKVWEIYSDYLHLMHHGFGVRIGCFVLMTNHFHMLARFPGVPLSESAQYFMRETSRSIGGETGRINHVYGTRIFRSRISSIHHLRNVYKYVYRNPIEAGACSSVEDYRFSTLHGLLGQSRLTIPVEEDELLFSENTQTTLNWLNKAPESGFREALKYGLRSQNFKLPKIQSSRRAHPLEQLIY